MKLRYIISMVALTVIAAIFVYLILSLPFGQDPRIGNAIQLSGIFVALFAALIALAAVDSKRESVKAKIDTTVGKTTIGEYRKNELPDEIRKYYENAPDIIKSYRVQFKITNTSGFTLRQPTLTFKLPADRQHPHKVNGAYIRSFNSNLFNSQTEIRMLEFANTRILSNSNLPYWNHSDDVTIWIRMMLNDGEHHPFDVEVSLNCENADGLTRKVLIQPAEMLK